MPKPNKGCYSNYFALMAEGGRIGLCICKLCGAAILLGDKDYDSTAIHDAWHLAHLDAKE